jgi:NitT/TauT family transport system permease protein
MSKVYNVSKKDMAVKFFVPYIMPSFLDSIRSAISLNVKLVIAAEVLAQTRDSMGVMMQRSSIFLDTPTLMAWTIAAIVLSYLFELLVKTTKTLTVRWQR